MRMTLRWFGQEEDSVKLDQIRQIPGVEGVISALHHIPAGAVWPLEEIIKLKETVESNGIRLVGIESVNLQRDFCMEY